MNVQYGKHAEQEHFAERNARFVERGQALTDLINLVVGGRGRLKAPNDRVVYTLGRIGVEEFWEIVVTAANGYGVAALKLLRRFSNAR